MRGEQRLEDRLLVDDLRAALEHHDRVRLGRDHHRDVALLRVAGGRIDDQLAVDAAHPHRRHRPVVRDVGDFQRGRSGDQREHVGVVVAIGGKHRDDDLGFLVVALGEQRAHRAVDQPRGQDFLFRGTALALEKAAGDFAGGEGALLVIHRERQEVDIGAGVVGRHDGREHHGFAILRQHRAMRLLGQPSGLERQLAAGKIESRVFDTSDLHLREDGGAALLAPRWRSNDSHPKPAWPLARARASAPCGRAARSLFGLSPDAQAFDQRL